MNGGVVTSLNFSKHPLPVDVYVNPTNSQQFYVDLDAMPSLQLEDVEKLVKEGVVMGSPTLRIFLNKAVKTLCSNWLL
jgi:hypothetical protein